MQKELDRVQGPLPYKELKGKGTVSAQAEEAWDYARSRSSSVINDLFAGQLQSTVTCPACGVESHSFEDFYHLSCLCPRLPSQALAAP